jgi:hypothetical protein
MLGKGERLEGGTTRLSSGGEGGGAVVRTLKQRGVTEDSTVA